MAHSSRKRMVLASILLNRRVQISCMGFLLAGNDFLFGEAVQNPEEHQLYRSAYYLGRGDTGIADTDDQEAIFYNPAGLAQGEGIYKKIVLGSPQAEVSSSVRNIYKRLQVDKESQTTVLRDQIGEPIHAGVQNLSAIVFRRAALGALVAGNANALVRMDPNFGGLETVNGDYISSQVLTFSLAEKYFGETICIGGTGKYVNRGQARLEANIIDAEAIKKLNSSSAYRTGSGSGADVGILIKTGKSVRLTEHSIGVTVKDLGDTQFIPVKEGETLDPLKQTINVGYALSIGTKYSRLKLLAEAHDVAGNTDANPIKRSHFGSELSVANSIGMTGGLNQGYSTGGFYLDLRLLRIDVAFYTLERGAYVGQYPDQRYVARVVVGF